jgi:hypothetical protein
MSFCTVGRIPINGDCVKSLTSAREAQSRSSSSQKSSVLLSLELLYPAATSKNLAGFAVTDSTREFFDFLFGTEMGNVLSIDPQRVSVKTISATSETDVVVVTFTISPQSQTVTSSVAGDARVASECAELLIALEKDKQSLLYKNSLFSGVVFDVTQPVAYPTGLALNLCPDGKYRSSCPSVAGGETSSQLSGIGAMLLGMLLTAAGLIVTCALVWRVDAGSDQTKVHKSMGHMTVKEAEQGLLDPSMKAEFARSWLEGRWIEDVNELRKRRMKMAKREDMNKS